MTGKDKQPETILVSTPDAGTCMAIFRDCLSFGEAFATGSTDIVTDHSGRRFMVLTLTGSVSPVAISAPEQEADDA